MVAATPRRIYTIPAGRPFLTELARAILGGTLPRTEHLPDTLLLLPTRRACRAMEEAFLAASGGRALLLPRIRPMGDADEDEGLILHDGAFDLPPAMDKHERHLILTSLVLKWIAQRQKALADAAATDVRRTQLPGAGTPAEASALARGLASLMDMVETEGADLGRLKDLAPAMFAEQWGQTLDFLGILSEVWPAILAASEKLSPAARRNHVLARQAEMWRLSPPTHPVIAAGVTGSIPATADLMAAVAELPNGAVVLAGLDRALDEESWAGLTAGAPSHPQFRLARLLRRLGATREDVGDLEGRPAPADIAQRQAILTEVMRPAETTAAWAKLRERQDPAAARAAFAAVTRLDAASPEDEAEALALILRRAADDPKTTTALVTPDRNLARRVAVRLTSWGIAIDDSAGRPVSKSPPGVLFDLVAAAVGDGFRPATLMALLKHPLTRLGLPVADVRRGARMLELRTLRRPDLGGGLAGLKAILAAAAEPPDPDDHEAHHAAIASMGERDLTLAGEVLTRLETALAPFIALFCSEQMLPLETLLDAHIAAAEAVARDEEGQPDALWAEASGETAARLLAALKTASKGTLELDPDAYPNLYRSLVAGETLRAVRTSHPHLSILGPFEARLLRPDTVILGGLNDGVAPEIAEPDPWLNRPMLAALGLPAPETRIGDAAHDFVQLLGCSRVYLTRAVKRDGAPTVPSRWLQRLDAVLGGLESRDALAGDPAEPWLAWAQNQKALPGFKPRPAPEPRPPLAARPRKLSVTRIEHWMANPYAIFARDILRLLPMPELGGTPGASMRGRIIHQALHRFAARHPEKLPEDVAAALMAEASRAFERLAPNPRVAAFWRPRFQRFATWFALTEAVRRGGVGTTLSEVPGALVLATPGGAFRLTARADRIDLCKDGSLIVTDYKTGAVPGDKRVHDGLAPQLPLEAAIAAAGGFEGVPRGPVAILRYVTAKGGEPPGEDRPVASGDVAEIAAQVLAGLEALIARYDDPATPYPALRRLAFKDAARHDDYGHLARVKEWGLLADGGRDDF